MCVWRSSTERKSSLHAVLARTLRSRKGKLSSRTIPISPVRERGGAEGRREGEKEKERDRAYGCVRVCACVR